MTGILDVFDKISVFEDFASELERTEILDFNVDMNKNSVTVSLGADFLIDKKKLSEYINQVKYTYSLSELEINIKYKNIEFSDEYYKGLLETLFSKSAACRAFLGKSSAVFSDNVLKISGVRCGRAILEATFFAASSMYLSRKPALMGASSSNESFASLSGAGKP